MTTRLWREAVGDGGYTLIELLVAGTLVILLTALTCRVLLDARASIDVSVEGADLHQRARVAVDAIASRLRGAGAGADRGVAVGRLARWAPPIVPGRHGDPASLSNAVTLIEVLGRVAPATLSHDVSASSGTLDFDYVPGCAPPCGFFERMTVIVFDERGDFDLFVLTTLDGTAATVRRMAVGTGGFYRRGTVALPAELRTFYFNAPTLEIRTFDGDRSDLPVVNGVVELTFDYLGDPQPPSEPRPPAGEENCLYDSSGARRPELQPLPRADGSLARLSPTLLQDGPWCGAGPQPFDADLLRIRAVRLAVRLQATSAAHRGVGGRWFRNAGTAVESSRVVKDLTLRTTITPPNLGAGR
jgi:type II secretory pathway pseudopilin PulG